MINKKYHNVGTIPKSNIKIAERGKTYTLTHNTANVPGLVQALQYKVEVLN